METTFDIKTEDDGWDMLQYLKARFGWQIAIYDRQDVDDWLNRPSTDEEWETIRNSDPWKWNRILEFAPENRYEAMCDLMNDLGIVQDEA